MKLREKELIILGHKGMLGQTVLKYFDSKVKNIITFDERFNFETAKIFAENLLKYPDAVIINCIGKINQKTNNPEELYVANSFLPLVLAETLNESQLLIHPGTDCIFSGKKGKPYKKTDKPDAKDTYGWSKTLGEKALTNRKNTIIVRVSIIGLDNTENPKGLLGWFLSNPGGTEINGFTNHLWNGITTLEWSKQAESLIKNHRLNSACKLVQLGTEEHFSKYEMLMLFQDVFKTNFKIRKFETKESVDKRLIPDIVSKKLRDQLAEMKNFYYE